MKILFVVSTVILLFANCSSVKITKSWSIPNQPTREFTNILIIAVTKDSEVILRRKMEHHLVGDLKIRGYNAHSAIATYGPDGFYKMDSLTAYNKLRTDNVDGVITIVLLNTAKEKYFVPGKSVSLVSSTPDQMWDYHKDFFNRIESPGYYKEATKYFWESNFYDLKKKELIYSVRTQSFDPNNVDILSHQYGLRIVKDMVHNRVLKNANSIAKNGSTK